MKIQGKNAQIVSEMEGPPLLLKVTLLSVLVLPAYMVMGPLGASGSVGHVLALSVFVIWMAAAAFGLHNPWIFGHPGRAVLLFWIIASCLSYIALFSGFSGGSDNIQRAAADRWILLIGAGAGITLMTTETVRTLSSLRLIVRIVIMGAVISCVVALFQFTLRIDPMTWVSSMMLGFENNGSGTPFQERGTFARVAGSTMHPIELGVITSMLLPLSLWWAKYDRSMPTWFRVAAPILLFAGNVMTVSRTSMLGLVVAAVIAIPFMPILAKKWAVVVVPMGTAVLFLMVPGMVTTLFSSATAGSSDASITYRTDDYPLAWLLFFDHPFLGLGPGAWIPVDPKNIFDNQYLLTVITLGCIGLLAFLLYLLVPAFAALMAARRAESEELRFIGGCLGAAMLVAAISAGTFDAMSFQTFALITPFFVGLQGTVWLMVKGHPAYSITAEREVLKMKRQTGGISWIR
ncbi:O-antigen ligase family protein [Paeniglutamicibacter gangotriensis]|uniref:O-antigen ligase family protein n=1 Tax=Paeniglutamicibacter gangotriensis TaxID=254787 RepID=A0A5B0EGK4_9MICC|nr:O-antigen ligase family protein [Paeniglutamicibacter gangotriensis]KAA0977552.1 O-antigen ligase family protein [Paeniglutamicibacter gangotriensis]